jgi:hypothetical protein
MNRLFMAPLLNGVNQFAETLFDLSFGCSGSRVAVELTHRRTSLCSLLEALKVNQST